MNKFLILIVLLGLGCTSSKKQPVIHIGLINKGQSLQFTGLDKAVMQEIARDSSDEVWQSFIPVYRMPADTDMKTYQPVQPGNYRLNDSAVVFTPDTPFVKKQEYFVRYYLLGEGLGLSDYLKGSASPGKTHFIDLIFKQ
ncbi:hypothetical protein [Mucilaginibacter segetis]|uniref:Lipoprotein n=1 Tax=Mucilaginibacter segetis TaxID=2793071 RepID=A0A934PT35_9SPHI|nr:hypothetical protein [Mucilaginibacter segetis]MBK0380313.1 hypothetical protein [Mucilaginibacter segetis]